MAICSTEFIRESLQFIVMKSPDYIKIYRFPGPALLSMSWGLEFKLKSKDLVISRTVYFAQKVVSG